MVDQVIIIGTGRLPALCLGSARQHHAHVSCVEPEHQVFSPLKGACGKLDVEYRQLTDKRALNDFFTSLQVPTLVVSAYNLHLFSAEAIDNPNLAIVNFHNSLLPRHRGRNAPTWAIYELDTETGVTWHKVSRNIDSGQIIAQQSISIGEQMTALDLTQKTLDVGALLFDRLVPQLLQGSFPKIPLVESVEGVLHRAKEIPNDGRLEVSWSPRKISAFLRALDYGRFGIFPRPTFSLLGASFQISGYELSLQTTEAPKISMESTRLTIQGDGLLIEANLLPL